MEPILNNSILLNINSSFIRTIDSHTAGEATRLIVGGIDRIDGNTMGDKLNYFKTHHDQIRKLLTKEPRGSKEILAAAVTDPVTEEARFGLIYMDAKRYPYLCGHATIGAVVTLAKTGVLNLIPGENTVGVDTPSGFMEARVFVENDSIASVAIHMVPSFVYQTGQSIEIKGFGPINVDIVCTGGFFAMVDTDKIDISPELKNKDILIDLGMKIIEAANAQLKVQHPVRPDVNTIDVTEFYKSENNHGHSSGSGMVIYGESHADRSPCGTGTAAKLTLLHHYKKIKMHESYTNYSPLGTSFEAKLVKKQSIGPFDAYVAEIKGMAYLTGIHDFFIESQDPFQQGYII